MDFNNKLEEVKNYLLNVNGDYDKQELIASEIVSKIDYLQNWDLDELSIDGIEGHINLDTYTNDVFNIVIKLVCNVLDSYKENN